MMLYFRYIVFCVAYWLWACQPKLPVGREKSAFYQYDIDSIKRAPSYHQVYGEPWLDFGFDLQQFDLVYDTVRKNQSLVELLKPYKIGSTQLADILRLNKKVYDLSKIKAGAPLLILKDPKTDSVKHFIYEIDKINYVVFSRVENGSFVALRDSHLQITEQSVLEGTIQKGSSLSETVRKSAQNSALSQDLEAKLIEIYSWTIDFFKTQPGDYFKVIYNQKIVRGQVVGVEKIHAAVYKHAGSQFYSFYYPTKDMNYFDEKGFGLRKFFLSAPLKFSRISSRFTGNRFHPVQKIWKAHLGTDYAAPVGTPIWATADGIVVEATYNPNNGNYVKIRHNNTYQTQYLHMSRIAQGMHAGVRIRQGQIIGYVGSTGLASGPHVCYRFWKNGSQIDPNRERSFIKSDVNVGKDPKFSALRDSLMQLLKVPS
jgi:murein DD-endopeptidase MepM/ murein hydrolase activator NlpD